MVDAFSPLIDCSVALPVARVLDRIAYYRLVPLVIPTSDGTTQQAIVPADHVVPNIVKELAIGGWPTDNLVDARRGVPLLSEWQLPAREAITRPIVQHVITDPDQFLADPVVTFGTVDKRLALSPVNVHLLLQGRQTLVRSDDGPPVLLQMEQATPIVGTSTNGDGQVVIRDITSVLAERAVAVEGQRLQLSATNVRQLREHGSTWLVTGEGEAESTIRVISAPAVSAGHDTWTFGTITEDTGNGSGGPIINVGSDLTKNDFIEPLPDFPFVVHLAYEQQWTLRGYARGDLITSIALTPQEETTIEISTWDRYRRTDDQTTESAWETSLDVSWTNRVTHEVVRDIADNESWKLTKLGVDIPTGQGTSTVGADLEGDFGTSINEINKSTCNTVDDLTVRGAAKFRGLRQTKVTESHEWGFEEKTTRKLRNPNMCQSISYDVFEMLAAYDVATRPVPEQTRLAVLVPNPLPVRFDRWSVLAFEGLLRGALLDAAQEPGFVAARWLAAREEYCSLCLEPSCCPQAKEPVQETAQPQSGQGTGTATVQGSVDRVKAIGDKVAAAIITIRDATHHVASDYDKGLRGAQLEPAILTYRQWLFRVFGLEWFQPGYWGSCLRFAMNWGSNKTPERLEQLLNETASAWLEAVGRASLAILLAQAAVPVMAVQLGAHLGWKTLWYAPYTARGFDDAGLGALLATARTEVETWRKTLPQPAPAAGAKPEPEERKETAEETGEPADPFPLEQVAGHRVAERALLAHLEQNRSHYLEAMWRAIGPADRVRILETVFDKLGPDLEPEVLGFIGDRVAVPFRIANYPRASERFTIAMSSLPNDAPGAPQTVVLPTPGVHIQARLGACDACEPYVTELRHIELSERRAKASQVQAEAEQAYLERERLETRLRVEPQQLDNPRSDGGSIQVRLVRDDESDA
jgi:hypothetical protein